MVIMTVKPIAVSRHSPQMHICNAKTWENDPVALINLAIFIFMVTLVQ